LREKGWETKKETEKETEFAGRMKVRKAGGEQEREGGKGAGATG